MNPNDFGDTLTFSLSPSFGLNSVLQQLLEDFLLNLLGIECLQEMAFNNFG